MTKNYFKSFVFVILLIVSSCKTIEYKQVEEINKDKKLNISKTIEYFIDKNFNSNSLNCIAIGEIIDKSKSKDFPKLEKSNLIRRSLFGFLSIKNYKDIELSRINYVIQNFNPTSKSQLLEFLNCDAIITGEITKFKNQSLVTYSKTTIEIK